MKINYLKLLPIEIIKYEFKLYEKYYKMLRTTCKYINEILDLDNKYKTNKNDNIMYKLIRCPSLNSHKDGGTYEYDYNVLFIDNNIGNTIENIIENKKNLLTRCISINNCCHINIYYELNILTIEYLEYMKKTKNFIRNINSSIKYINEIFSALYIDYTIYYIPFESYNLYHIRKNGERFVVTPSEKRRLWKMS